MPASPWALHYCRRFASHFGLYGKNVGGNFQNFERYTARVDAFMPASTVPFLAWAATFAEFSRGIALIVGVWTRWIAFGSPALLAIFGTCMPISMGIKEPLDYSVFSASAAALLLALCSKPDQSH